MSVRSTAERYAELLTERSLTTALLANAKKWRDELMLEGGQEYDWWAQRVNDLDLQLREDNARIKAVLSQEDKERFADEREAARREDDNYCGAQNAIQWEA